MLTISNIKGQSITFKENELFYIKAENIESAFSPTFIKDLIMKRSQDCFDKLTTSITKK